MLVKLFRSVGVLQQILQQDEVCCKVLQNEIYSNVFCDLTCLDRNKTPKLVQDKTLICCTFTH